MKLLAVLDEIAFLSEDSEASVRLANGARLRSRYRGGDDLDPRAFVYEIAKPIDAEEAYRLLEYAVEDWSD